MIYLGFFKQTIGFGTIIVIMFVLIKQYLTLI